MARATAGQLAALGSRIIPSLNDRPAVRRLSAHHDIGVVETTYYASSGTGVRQARDPIPNAATILEFRHVLKRRGLTALLSETVFRRRGDAGAMRKGGDHGCTLDRRPVSSQERGPPPR